MRHPFFISHIVCSFVGKKTKTNFMRRALFLLLSAVMLSAACTRLEPGQVKVTGGIIQGTVLDDMTVYKGIPFAAPPVGENRWKAPQPVVPWEGVKDATKFGKGPIQGSGKETEEFSEDCLYLNVWTPAKSPKDKLPVLVWIYGGGFSMGSSAFNDGSELARKGVILVSMNYRVGQLGFFAHPELSAENPEGVSGNYGILDQIEALKWVQENIAAFGGDPEKVTIFGESAGGISVSMLCASPLAKGLFRGAISQSGGSFGPPREDPYPGENMMRLADAEKDGVKFAERLGAASIDDLRAMDPSRLGLPFTLAGGAWPVVDGYVIPDDQYLLYDAGKFNDVDILVGYNSDEGASFTFGNNSAEAHKASVIERYGPFAEALLKEYPVEGPVLTKSARDLSRDASFGWHTWTWARLQAEKGNSNVYLYYFDQHPDHSDGSPHGQDVDFVFKALKNEAVDTDFELSDIMATYWTNFAKYGNPNGEGLPEWPEFTSENHVTMVLKGDAPYPAPVPDESSMEVLDAYFKWRRDQ